MFTMSRSSSVKGSRPSRPEPATAMRSTGGGYAPARPGGRRMDDIGLIDHHCHGVATGDLDQAAFENMISESFDPPPPGASHFDAPLGLAIRRWCAPFLDLEPFPSPEEYVARRRE